MTNPNEFYARLKGMTIKDIREAIAAPGWGVDKKKMAREFLECKEKGKEEEFNSKMFEQSVSQNKAAWGVLILNVLTLVFNICLSIYNFVKVK